MTTQNENTNQSVTDSDRHVEGSTQDDASARQARIEKNNKRTLVASGVEKGDVVTVHFMTTIGHQFVVTGKYRETWPNDFVLDDAKLTSSAYVRETYAFSPGTEIIYIAVHKPEEEVLC